MKTNATVYLDLRAICLALALILPLLMTGQDVKGSEDYALLSRYPGSTIVSYFKNNFTNYPLFKD
ncbi:MAG: hypothetical protein AAFV80_18135, partial [Bacteroidota bacterium]